MKYHISILLLLFFTVISLFNGNAQTNWVLKKEKNGIQVFEATQVDSKFKALRVLCTIQASMHQLIAVLKQTEIQPEWVMAAKNVYTVKTISSTRLLYYSEAVLPWPMSNRDMVIDLSFVQDPKTKILTINANTIDHILPLVPGKERVPLSNAQWLVKSDGNNKISIDYTLRINPGGGIPPWMVNLFMAKAPLESFSNLSRIIQEKRFKDQQFDFLKD